MKVSNDLLNAKKNKPLSMVIIGQGAIGLLWYCHFYKQQHSNVYLLEHYKDRQQQDITFSNINNITEYIPRQEVNIKGLTSAENILICVKCHQVDQVINDISPYLKNKINIVLCHNGMGALNDFSQALLSRHNVLTLLTTHGCFKSSASEIKHTGLGHSDLGLTQGTFKDLDKDELLHQFNSALPTTTWCENIKIKQWLKLAINCVINPITAINNIENGKILSEKFENIIDNILLEVITLAQCEGIPLSLESLKKTVLEVAHRTANNSSSMRCDIQAKRTSEIAHINGYIQKLGRHYNIKTPINDSLIAQIQAL